jgi:hypothetical protein
MAGPRRDWLQTEISGRNFRLSSMNDFPVPEDPPVMVTARIFSKAASGVNTTVCGLIYSQAESAPPA